MEDVRKKVFNKLLSPPCPNCQSYNIEPLGNRPPLMVQGNDFVKAICEGRGWVIETFKCKKCGTLFDRLGDAIVSVQRGRFVKGFKKGLGKALS